MLDNYVIDSDENSDYMYNVIDGIIKASNSRAPGSEGERIGAEWVKNELDKFCDRTELEEFKLRPGAFLGFFRVVILLFAISFVIFLFSPINKILFSSICLGFAVFIILIFYYHFFNYNPILAPLFKEKTSQNVMGIIKPKNEIKKRVIFSGHIDSAFRFNFIQYTKHGYAYFLITSIGALVTFFVMYIFQLISGFQVEDPLLIANLKAFFGSDLDIFTYFRLIMLLILPAAFAIFILIIGKYTDIFWRALRSISLSTTLIILGVTAYCYIVDISAFVIIGIEINLVNIAIVILINWLPSLIFLFFFTATKGVPGAIDNLSGVAISLCVAKILNDWKVNNLDLYPKNTEVIIAAFGSEEAGLVGAYEFAKKHSKEFNKIETTCVNMDSIMNSKVLNFYTKEDTTRTILDRKIVDKLVKIAKEFDINHEVISMPSFGGGTDAAGLVRGGLRATSIECIPREDYMFFYHTTRDDINIINKKRRPCDDHGTKWNNRNVRCAFENTLKVCIGYLKLVDSK
ncbi:MAG: M28 family peptidase [Candidatus Helarchaeota archaeon]